MSTQVHSRNLLGQLRDVLAHEAVEQEDAGQARLDSVVDLIAQSIMADVCSIYLFRDAQTLELCATHGLSKSAVHHTWLKIGEGLVGRVARSRKVLNTEDAPATPGFRYMPETGEDKFSSFCGVPIQRLGEVLGVLVVQSGKAHKLSADAIYALEIVAMVLAEMAELGAFVGDSDALRPRHQEQAMFTGTIGQEGTTFGTVFLHEPRVVVTNPISDDPEREIIRLNEAIETLKVSIDTMVQRARIIDKEQRQIFEAYRLFANSQSWVARLEADIQNGLSAEAAVEKEQSFVNARLGEADSVYMRGRASDLDDLSNRLLRILTGQGRSPVERPKDAILVARDIGPSELLEYGKTIKGIVLESGAVGSHATIIARAWAIPLVLNAKGVTAEALNGDLMIVDGEQGIVHLRPDEAIQKAFSEKKAMQDQAQARYVSLRNKPALTRCCQRVELHMNAGLMADLPSLADSGAEGVGLFRTELQFLARNAMPRRDELISMYRRIMQAAHGKPIAFRTLDIGSDKVLPYIKATDEPNPAMGWRAIRVGLDRPGMLRMQLQALIRAADGGPLSIMFPFIAQHSEFQAARHELHIAIERERKLGHKVPGQLKVGAMLETPSLAFAPNAFFEDVDFISVGGNDLKQFFFAADRENERVRQRYDMISSSYLSFIQHIVERCGQTNTQLSFCGEDAGRPLEAICLAALGINKLSMRPASIGPVKHALRCVDLTQVKVQIDAALQSENMSARTQLATWLKSQTSP